MTDSAAVDQIVRAVIYPAIGVARVGNSEYEYVVGPEVPDPPRLPAGSYRDKAGALKRQAARFRIYGVNAAGEIVRELSGEGTGAKITWHVELANAKAAWYTFQLALDIPEAASAPTTTLRNPTVADRSKLSILPGPRSVAGANAKPALFDNGAFMGRTVYLGEIFTDAAGRLLVLGGRGVSASHDGSAAKDFANNDGWFDDTSDGPVTAEVSLDGKPLDVTPAWVVVTPPNYGPRRKSVRTMWDLMRDVAVKSNSLAVPERSFQGKRSAEARLIVCAES
ncbi:LodA/GoxA family CTQ-dependent oxidase [Bradyrhizobium barranii subsp. apii]|uniref:LodA/GoxA family CTQ-dependent oxidase n=1 Tax=Bradyrhizobium barranii TaxID=2992140 RepID=UPI001AA19BD6|nr:LodA/GoxA family CTQ-dependent oxidase [Bradyrhizobium barranii]UPT95005.1 LodA/GoxA family CTQ-dependent oxidase [Bradyrhizobium barranii subsp. apii]